MSSKIPKTHPEQAFADHCCDILGSVGLCSAKRMFGGWGIKCDGLMIGLISAETLYLKIDPTTKPQFLAAGGRPFVWDGSDKKIEMSFITPPEEAMDARHFMAPWARIAMEAALRNANAKPTKPTKPAKPAKPTKKAVKTEKTTVAAKSSAAKPRTNTRG
jgi:DNA transformation protein